MISSVNVKIKTSYLIGKSYTKTDFQMRETDRSYSKLTLEFVGASFVLASNTAKIMDRL